MRAKNLIKIIFIASLVFIFTSIINANPKLTEEQKEIMGTWQIKRTVSNKASFIPAGFTPESLILAADNDLNEITINEGFKEFVRTQTLPTNGTMVAKNVFQIGKVTFKAFWQGKSLVVETVTEKGDKLTESFELSANKKQLLVNIQLTKKGSAKTLKTRRIFDRVAEINENNTAQVGISAYPF